MARVNFFVEDIDFKVPFPRKTSHWIQFVFRKERKHLQELNYIFCSDEYLRGINKEYLSHTTYTDIVTFDNSESPKAIEGDVFISIDRVKENAEKYGVSFLAEFRRVLVHGALHLMGYADKKPKDKGVMRKKEDTYISLYDKQ